MALFINTREDSFDGASDGASTSRMRRRIQIFVATGLVNGELHEDIKGSTKKKRQSINVGSPFSYITDKVIGENVSANMELLLGVAKTSASSYNLSEEEREDIIGGIAEATVNITRASQYVSIIATEIQSGIFEFNEMRYHLMQLAEKSGDYAKHMLAISNSYKEKALELANQGDEMTAKDIELISEKFSNIAATFEGISLSVDVMLDNVTLSIQAITSRAEAEKKNRKKNEMVGIFKKVSSVINKALHGDKSLAESATAKESVSGIRKEAVLKEVADGIHKGLSKAVKQAGSIQSTLEDALVSMSSQLANVNKDITKMIKENKHEAIRVNSANLKNNGVQFRSMSRP